jgi:hypothetical protein
VTITSIEVSQASLGFQSGLIQNWQRGFGVKSSDIWCRFRIVAVGLLTLGAGATSLWLGVGGTLAAGTMAWDSLRELANFCRSPARCKIELHALVVTEFSDICL